MLKWLFAHFGLVGTVLIVLTGFIVFIFWVSGIAGIVNLSKADKRRHTLMALSILIPPFPFFWMVRDIVTQYRALRSND